MASGVLVLACECDITLNLYRVVLKNTFKYKLATWLVCRHKLVTLYTVTHTVRKNVSTELVATYTNVTIEL